MFSEPFMTFITHPLNRITEIYIFCRKTHTSSTVSDFLSFRKTTGKITSTLLMLFLITSLGSRLLKYSVERQRPPFLSANFLISSIVRVRRFSTAHHGHHVLLFFTQLRDAFSSSTTCNLFSNI
ncbi:hypothetical protein RCL_jg606.t1 [Rhizophagus clarus]|uniref:Uncharacterized protein n=1 Tax=Rhizophagus clarus TaxID=94130 RepID=A0A8H3LNN0_9GLOM|nr:hypothetical protein RCL_jg606.t1 [Rhizophagus clarus]